ncbi:hypothetical protein [Brevibacillus brevis]|uniref:hypothetical protein n=1 Tax=Brevibacillus brevis TaxID=1393 RepID=UPI00165D8699|nr:hypothetical protein [Brevibacillus brevis]
MQQMSFLPELDRKLTQKAVRGCITQVQTMQVSDLQRTGASFVSPLSALEGTFV